MTDGQLDKLWNLINALSDRIRDLETEVRGLSYRTDNAENKIDRLNWRIDHD